MTGVTASVCGTKSRYLQLTRLQYGKSCLQHYAVNRTSFNQLNRRTHQGRQACDSSTDRGMSWPVCLQGVPGSSAIYKVQQISDQAGRGYSFKHKVPQSYALMLADFYLLKLNLSPRVEHGNFGIQSDTASDGVDKVTCHGVSVPNRGV
jgi:hypothetical protein